MQTEPARTRARCIRNPNGERRLGNYLVGGVYAVEPFDRYELKYYRIYDGLRVEECNSQAFNLYFREIRERQ